MERYFDFKLNIFVATLLITISASGQNYVKTDVWLDSAHTAKTTEYQYYDGLGREAETATNALGTTGTYVHTVMTYDSNGRPKRKWLPVVGAMTPDKLTSSSLASFCQSTYQDPYAYFENHYNALDEPIAVDEAGADWHAAGKQTVTNYDTNVYGEVKVYTATTAGNLVKGDYHPAGALDKISVTDADGQTLITYKDFLGRILLKRQTAVGADSLDTYYVYDERGQLAYVLSPGYQESGKKAIYGYGYLYDNYGRCVKKSLPQSGYTLYWYDNTGRVTGEQTQMMRDQGKRRFFLYDSYGRIVVQGLCDAQQDYTSHEVAFTTAHPTLFGSGYVQPLGSVYNPEIEVINYYDNYDFRSVSLYTGSFAHWHLDTAFGNGRQTASIRRVSDGHLLLTQTYYDHHGDTRAVYKAISSGGARLTTLFERSFTGKPLSVRRTLHYKGTTTTINSSFTLADNSDFITAESMTVNGGSPIAISEFTYDGLGRVTTNSRNTVGDVLNYSYNLRGWLTNISGGGINESIYYTSGTGVPRYCGDISSIVWDGHTANGNRYKFGYDAFGRLLSANYIELSGQSPDYSERLGEYRANGNFRRLQRWGRKTNGKYGKIDNLHLYFDYNRLKAVREDALPVYRSGAFDFKGDSTTTKDDIQYAYYDDGSLKWDSNKGIAHIAYTPQCNPVRVQFKGGHTTEYVYSADGQRLRTIHRTAVPNITLAMGDTLSMNVANTLSADTTEYFCNFVFENGQLSKYLFDGGYCTFTGANSQPVCHFYSRDHLGNVRAVIGQGGVVEQRVYYYPLGGIYADKGSNDALQKYKYNGKELDRMHGLNLYDYGARQYDPILGMFTQTDPLCEKYYNFHPYAYCLNNPVNSVDPDGRKVILNGSQEERMTMLSYLQRLTNDNLFVNRKTGEVTFCGLRWGNRNRILNVGTSLLRDLINHNRTIRIQIGEEDDRNRYHPTYPKDASNGKGTDGYINLNPAVPATIRVQDSKTGETIVENPPMEITVGHELIHAYSAMNGDTPNEEKKSSYVYKDLDGQSYKTQAQTRETETVGLNGNYIYTENKLRKEHGLNKRVAY